MKYVYRLVNLLGFLKNILFFHFPCIRFFSSGSTICIQVILSDEFRKSFTKLKSPQLRREVLQKLIKLGGGWRTTVKNLDIPGVSHLAKVYKVRDLYLVWSTDVEKTERRYFQIIRIWDLLSQQNLARTIQRLENLFSMYTDDYLDHCRRVQTQGYELFIVNEL
jgi:hypothetical protein